MERIDKVQNLIPEKPEFVHSNQEKGEDVESLKIVNRPVVKKDAAALVTGKAVYTNDLAPSDCLIVKVVRSPYAHALIKDINTARAEAVPGIECVLTYKDCPNTQSPIGVRHISRRELNIRDVRQTDSGSHLLT